MRISDWSSDVCSSDLTGVVIRVDGATGLTDSDAHPRLDEQRRIVLPRAELVEIEGQVDERIEHHRHLRLRERVSGAPCLRPADDDHPDAEILGQRYRLPDIGFAVRLDGKRNLAREYAADQFGTRVPPARSEEHTSVLQSLM